MQKKSARCECTVMGMNVNEQVSIKKKIYSLKFMIIYTRTNPFINVANSPGMAGWSKIVLNFLRLTLGTMRISSRECLKGHIFWTKEPRRIEYRD